MAVVRPENPNVTLDEDVRLRCHERFDANLLAFRRLAPQLADTLEKMSVLHSDLVPVGDDDWDIHFRGVPLFGRGARAYAEDQFALWEKTPVRVKLANPSTSEFDFHGGQFVEELRGAIESRHISIGVDIVDPRSFHLVCFGIGLGFHLPLLFERTKARNIFLFETNVEFLYHSLRVFDWAGLFDAEKFPLTQVHFVTSIDLQKAPIALREQIRSANPVCVDGASFYQLYPNDQYRSVITDTLKGIALAMSGLGFLDDEVRMVRNTYLNLKKPAPLMFKAQNPLRDWPLFLVGSGPSLDPAIDHIKRNADRAVIVSCGTSLPALLRNGIRPDVFAVLENGPEIYDYVKAAAETWGLEGVTLLASSTVDPRLADLFDHAVLYMRAGLASFPLFCQEPWMCMANGYPTVTNTGFGMAIAFGYKEIYLFGVDLGSRVPEQHHSVDSPYMADDMEFTDPLTQAVPGNFGGSIYTSYVLDWSRDVFEQTIAATRRPLQVFNTSDGAFIGGSSPRLARTVNLPPQPGTKAEEMFALWGAMAPYGEERFRQAWSKDRLVEQSEILRVALKAALDTAPSARDAIIEMMRLVGPRETVPAHHFIRGTLMQLMIVSGYYFNRVAAEDAAELDQLLIKMLGERVDAYTDHVLRFITDLDSGKHTGEWLVTPQGLPSEW